MDSVNDLLDAAQNTIELSENVKNGMSNLEQELSRKSKTFINLEEIKANLLNHMIRHVAQVEYNANVTKVMRESFNRCLSAAQKVYNSGMEVNVTSTENKMSELLAVTDKNELTHKKMVEELGNEKKELLYAIEKAKNDNSQSVKERQDLLEENCKLKEELDELDKQLLVVEKKPLQKEEGIQNHEKYICQLKDEITKVDAETVKVSKELLSAEEISTEDAILQSITEYDAIIHELETKLAGILTELQNQQAEEEPLKNEVFSLESCKEKVNDDLVNGNMELEKLTKQCEELQESYDQEKERFHQQICTQEFNVNVEKDLNAAQNTIELSENVKNGMSNLEQELSRKSKTFINLEEIKANLLNHMIRHVAQVEYNANVTKVMRESFNRCLSAAQKVYNSGMEVNVTSTENKMSELLAVTDKNELTHKKMVEELGNEKKELLYAIEKAKNDNSQSVKERQDLLEENCKLKEELDELDKQLLVVEKKPLQKEEGIQNHEKYICQLKDEITKVDAETVKVSKELLSAEEISTEDAILQSITEYDAIIHELETKLAGILTELQNQQAEEEPLKNEVFSLESCKEKVNDDLVNGNMELEKLTKQCEELQESYDQEKERFHQQICTQEFNVNVEKDLSKQLSDQRNKWENAIKLGEVNIQVLKNTAEQLHSRELLDIKHLQVNEEILLERNLDYQNLKEAHNKLLSETTNYLQSELMQLENNNDKNKGELNRMEEETAELTEQISQIESEREIFKQMLENLTLQINETGGMEPEIPQRKLREWDSDTTIEEDTTFLERAIRSSR